MIRIILKYLDHQAITDELTSFGLSRTAVDEDGSPVQIEMQWQPFLRTPDSVDVLTGHNYTMVECPAELVDFVMAQNPQTFEIIWDNRINVAEEIPSFNVWANEEKTETRMQTVGVIA